MSKSIKLCSACSGTGYYDNTGSPKCGACHGLGIKREKMPYRLWKNIAIKYYGIEKSAIEKVFEYEKFIKGR